MLQQQLNLVVYFDSILSMEIFYRLEMKLKEREASGLLRSLPAGKSDVDFLSNDYLGLARSSELKKRIELAYEQLPENLNGATGSRLLSGNTVYAENLEKDLAQVFKGEKALLFNSGYVANLALLATIPQRGDTIIMDELAHACMKEGARLSFAEKRSFRHNDVDDLEKNLKKAQGAIFVVVESVYSMDGDFCPLREILDLCKTYEAHLIVDEAHSTGAMGVKGSGLACSLGVEKEIFARVYTFGKGMGVHGAVVIGSEPLIQYLINFARAFIYTTALPLHSLVSIRESFSYLGENPGLQSNLRAKIDYFVQTRIPQLRKKGILTTDSRSAIQGVIVPGVDNARDLASFLQNEGMNVRPILSPTVKMGSERLRVCLHNYNTETEMDHLTDLIIARFGSSKVGK